MGHAVEDTISGVYEMSDETAFVDPITIKLDSVRSYLRHAAGTNWSFIIPNKGLPQSQIVPNGPSPCPSVHSINPDSSRGRDRINSAGSYKSKSALSMKRKNATNGPLINRVC